MMAVLDGKDVVEIGHCFLLRFCLGHSGSALTVPADAVISLRLHFHARALFERLYHRREILVGADLILRELPGAADRAHDVVRDAKRGRFRRGTA